MKLVHPRAWLFGLGLAAVSSGCSQLTATADNPQLAASLQMYLSGLPVTRGAFAGMEQTTTLVFAAQVRDAAGHGIALARPTLVSRNPNVISLDSAGTMRVKGRGITWLVATYAIPGGAVLADSMSAGLVCTTLAAAGINLTVTDSISGAVQVSSLSISARSGAFRDSLFAPSQALPFSLGLAFERPGTFDVRVNAAGYREWAALGVVINTDLCHVLPVSLSARLQRQ